ncbi:hypothetical protein [Streptodolium elevatio]|uniref:Uncharacterized protein n=1 Tax=Streptodolium elevatio TaxID=3157996 RepID=A0ABV3D913_9ACTN
MLAPMLGLHIVAAVKWRRRAATNWTAYLQARVATSRRVELVTAETDRA